MDLKIDPELLDLIPRCCKDDDERLEKSLLNEGGCHHPVIVWEGRNIIIDGHRRKEACEKLGLSYPVLEMPFPDKESVKRWMLDEQLSRRNVTSHQKALLLASRLKLETVHTSKAAAERPGPGRKGGIEKAMENVAEETGVSARTVRRSNDYATAFQSLPDDIQHRIEDHSLIASKPAVIELAGLDEEQQREAVQSVDDGDFETLTACVLGEDAEQPAARPSAPTGSIVAMFSDAFRAVGTAKKILDPLARIKPNQNYKIIMGLLAKVGEKLEEWKKA